MKKLLMIPLLLIITAGSGCEQKQIITQLEVGEKKLLGAGLVIEAVENLKRAEIEEGNKTKPRALLAIAYAHGISTGMARVQSPKLEEEYKRERDRRVPALNVAEMKVIFQVLDERHRVQMDARQILIDRGVDVVPLILDSLKKGRYSNLQADFAEMLKEIGVQAMPQILLAIGDAGTPIDVKTKLVRLVGDIGDPSASGELEAIGNSSSSSGLKMEIVTTLYRLGKKEYREKIIAGLRASDVRECRAAAWAMRHLNDSPSAEIVDALKDADNRVCQHLVKALEIHPSEVAVRSLVNLLKSDSDNKVKNAAVVALTVHAENDLGRGLAVLLIDALTSEEVSDPEDRLRLVQLLKKKAVQKQIKMSPEDMNLEWKIWEYRRSVEQSDMVKDELDYLLQELESD
ncbi:MAG: HEAT repeat domain-containing protein [Candidatus Poribacteria bacterium]|nr:HEAT repeat domain-containing protein [Candidatus Poribacteria bacterium]MDE0503290.1 HEAT repeat domain-containing protein [Candidatus Poribacteria bacterium]